MKRSSLILVVTVVLVGGLAPAAFAADVDATWGTSGVATFAIPAGTTVTDTALLPDGRMVAVGFGTSFTPWGGIVAADGLSITPLSGFVSPDTRLRSVAVGNGQIYAVGDVGIGLGLSTVVAVFDSSGSYVGGDTFVINEFTVPTSVAVDGSGRPFVAGTGRGDDDGGETAWVVWLDTAGMMDGAFPTLFLGPPDAHTNPVAYVGASSGQAVAVVTGDDVPAPGATLGFHRITESGSVFMADFSSARTIVAADIDSSSGTAVFGSLTPGASLTAANYLFNEISSTGATAATSAGVWIDVAGAIEAGRLRKGEVLGAGEGDVNTFVQLVATGDPFGGRSDSELIDVATSMFDGSVYVTSLDVPAEELAISKYVGDDSGRFIDDDASVHEAPIERLEALGITRGCNPPVNDRYCPTANVSRGQMAAFLNRALTLPAATTTDFFVDDNGSVFEADINAIAQAGITLGCNPPTNDRYCPGDNVTRGQMASFIVRAVDGP